MIKRKWKVAAAFVGVMVLLSALHVTPAFSSIALLMPLKELVAKSNLIIVGNVKSYEGFVDDYIPQNTYERGVGRIQKERTFTRFTIEVCELIKGDYQNAEIEVTRFEGSGAAVTIDSRNYYLDKGDRVLIFLKWDKWNEKWFSVEIAASVFLVKQTENSEKLLATGDFAVMFADDEEMSQPRTGAILNLQSLDDVRQAVKNE